MKSILTLLSSLIMTMFSLGQATSINCDFESPCEIITIDTSIAGNLWQIGVPEKPIFNYVPHNKLVTDTVLPYSVNNQSVFNVKFKTSPWDFWIDISFEHFFDTDEMRDGGYIEVSDDNGQSWQNIIESPLLIWDSWKMYSDTNFLYDSTPGFSGYSLTYLYSAFTLWTMDVDTLNLRFVFISDSIDNQRNGWCIDYIQFFGWWEGIEENKVEKYKLYPNPVSGTSTLTFKNPEKRNLSFEVFNSVGKKIYMQNGIRGEQLSISKDKLSKGMHLFRLYSNQDVYCTGSFIVE